MGVGVANDQIVRSGFRLKPPFFFGKGVSVGWLVCFSFGREVCGLGGLGFLLCGPFLVGKALHCRVERVLREVFYV